MKIIRIVCAALTVGSAVFLVSRNLDTQEKPRQQVGQLPDVGFLLNSGWTIRPAGQQVPVDTFPMSSAISRNGKYLLVLNGGYNPPSISVIDIAQRASSLSIHRPEPSPACAILQRSLT